MDDDKLRLLDRYAAAVYAAYKSILSGKPDCTYHGYHAVADLCRSLLYESGFSRDAIAAARRRADEAYGDLLEGRITDRTRELDALVVDLLCLPAGGQRP